MSPEITTSVLAWQGSASEQDIGVKLTALVLNSVTSPHSRRSYRTGLERFFEWARCSEYAGHFSKAMVGEYRSHLLKQKLSPASINLRLSPIRRLAREMADNQYLDPALAAAIERVPGVERRGHRVGNWRPKSRLTSS